MSEITVTVTGTPPNGNYSSTSSSVQTDGTITVEPGTTTINFTRGSGEGWSFVDPWITINPTGGPFTRTIESAGQVSIEDQDPGGDGATFHYTLHTDAPAKTFDPEIINKGEG